MDLIRVVPMGPIRPDEYWRGTGGQRLYSKRGARVLEHRLSGDVDELQQRRPRSSSASPGESSSRLPARTSAAELSKSPPRLTRSEPLVPPPVEATVSSAGGRRQVSGPERPAVARRRSRDPDRARSRAIRRGETPRAPTSRHVHCRINAPCPPPRPPTSPAALGGPWAGQRQRTRGSAGDPTEATAPDAREPQPTSRDQAPGEQGTRGSGGRPTTAEAEDVEGEARRDDGAMACANAGSREDEVAAA